MVIKIGKLIHINISIQLYFLLMLNTLLCNPVTAELSITDERAHAIAKTELDQQVLLKVKINGLSTSVPFSIEGIEDFDYEPRGSFKQFFSFNGQNTEIIEHHYMLRPKATGSFTLGPAIVEHNNDRIHSNTCTLDVQKTDRRHRTTPTDAIFVECFPGKTTGFVGEKIPITLRFNSCKPVELIECLFPKVDKEIITFGPLEKTDERQKTMGSKKYDCVEWTCQLEIKKAGRHRIPPLTIVYNSEADSPFSNSFFNQFFDNFGASQQKKVSAKEFLMTIKPLPTHDKAVHGIGVFESFKATLDKTTITQGNGCVLRITLKGSAPLDTIQQPSLTLPAELKYYESASRLRTPDEKIFEYIVQGIQPGTWSIPRQEFIFFDTQKEEYSTLKTEPLNLTVQQDGTIQSINQSQTTEKAPGQQSYEIMPIYENGPWYPMGKRSLSLTFFIGLCSIPLLYILYLLIQGTRMRSAAFNKEYVQRKQAFIHARKQLNAAQKKQDSTRLHDIFITLFSQRCAIKPSLINQETIEVCLRKADCTSTLLEQWNRFFSEISEIAYAKQEKIDTQALFNRASVWIDQLGEVL